MKLTLIEDKLQDAYNLRLCGDATCRFKKSEVSNALVAVSNKLKELGDKYGPQKIRFWSFGADDDRFYFSWTRRLSDQEKATYKQLVKDHKAKKLKEEIKNVRKRAKELGILKK